MRFLQIAAAALALASNHLGAAAAKTEEEEEETLRPCVVKSPNTGSYFDLNPLAVKPPEESKDGTKISKDEKLNSWHARGHDYGANFTINFCAPVIESIPTFKNIHSKEQQSKVAGYYETEDGVYSIGELSHKPVFRGRKLVLNYTGGSFCDPVGSEKEGLRRKATYISLLCEREITSQKVSISFVAASEDHCSYFFEARSFAFCPTLATQKAQMGPGAVFSVIGGVALLVYLIGGIVYQRAVMHQRGWRQLPNYALWAGIAAFVKDVLIICGASSLSCIRGRQGYKNVASNGRIGGRPGSADDSNRLMDQFDEEWDD